MNANAHWFDERRTAAQARFRTQGLPNRRLEDWKYTDLKSAVQTDGPDTQASWSIRNLTQGVELFDLSNIDHAPAWVKHHLGRLPQTAMASAAFVHARSGFAIRVRANAQVSSPVSLELCGGGAVYGLVVVEEGASATILESTTPGTFSNYSIEIVVQPNASLTHVRLAPWASGSVSIEDYALRIDRGAGYRAHLFCGGAKLSRAEFHIQLAAEGAATEMFGACVLGDGAHADVTTHIVHSAGQTTSRQLFKKIAAGKSRAVYQGRITVEQGANKSDSSQTAKALLVGANAEADLKPELEIYADDVKCAHGAAVGDLDADSLFYLRTRGICEAEARNMLVRAFVEEAVSEVRNDDLRAQLWQMVENSLRVSIS